MGGRSKSVTTGYRYRMGVQLALTHGPIDAVHRFIYGEREAWSGNVTDNAQIFVNAPELLGGDKREGGVSGYVDLMFGGKQQGKNPYLQQWINGPLPAFRGIVTAVFRDFLWSSGNPYFKSPWLEISRYTKGWSRDTPWYPQKAKIGEDMNGVHIVYECLTNLEWGMGYSPDDIDDASFRAAADKLYDEKFGLSLLWMEQTSILEFVKLVLTHFDGSIRNDPKTGRFQIRLIRNDYDVATLDKELSPANVIKLSSFQRTAWGDTANEVIVKYTDRDQNEVPAPAVHDLASIQAQGAVISVTRSYPGIREPSLAVRVAMRDLNNVSTPLAKITVMVNRVAWDWDVTDVFKFTWPKLGLNGVPFRIIKINKGNLLDGTITIEALEDIFGLPANAYVAQQPSGWEDPINDPLPVVAPRAIEAPYWDVVQNLDPADIAYLPDDYAFGETLAVKPTADAYDYDLHASANNSAFTDVGDGDFTPSGTITADIPLGGSPISVTINNMNGVDRVGLQSYAYIDNEAFIVTAVNPSTGVLALQRGTLDTVPARHLAGARIYFADNGFAGYDQTQRTISERTYYKALTRTGKGTLKLAQTTSFDVVFSGRAQRPYPPGNWTINGAYFPTAIYGPLASSWAHRDRTQQTVSLVPFTTSSIGPEIGTTYTLQVYSGSVLKRTYSGLTSTSWNYPLADDTADGVLQDLRLVLQTVRGTGATSTSWQRHDHVIDRHGLGFHLGEELGGVAP